MNGCLDCKLSNTVPRMIDNYCKCPEGWHDKSDGTFDCERDGNC